VSAVAPVNPAAAAVSDAFVPAPRVADLAKGYGELEKRVGSVPNEYDLSKSKYIDPNFEAFSQLKDFAKSKRVPQEFMDKMLESFDTYMDQFTVDPSAEIGKLGENAKQRLDILDNWVSANVSKEAYETLTSHLKTADAIKALEELRSKVMSNTPNVPNGNDASLNNGADLDELRAELTNNLEKYKTDPKYRKDLQSRLEQASKNVRFDSGM